MAFDVDKRAFHDLEDQSVNKDFVPPQEEPQKKDASNEKPFSDGLNIIKEQRKKELYEAIRYMDVDGLANLVMAYGKKNEDTQMQIWGSKIRKRELTLEIGDPVIQQQYEKVGNFEEAIKNCGFEDLAQTVEDYGTKTDNQEIIDQAAIIRAGDISKMTGDYGIRKRYMEVANIDN